MTRSLNSQRHRRLCHLLAAARQGRGLTQAMLAEKLRRPQSFVSKVERGERRLDVVEFLEVVEAIGEEPSRIIRHLQQG